MFLNSVITDKMYLNDFVVRLFTYLIILDFAKLLVVSIVDLGTKGKPQAIVYF